MALTRKQLDQRRASKARESLGVSLSTANRRLQRAIIFNLLQQLGNDACYRCGKIISIEELSLDHIKDWRNSSEALDLFFDVSNIAFSHLSCNTSAANRGGWNKGIITHGISGYRLRCRCEICRTSYSLDRRRRYMRNGK